jgi:hypothetical protein
MSVLSVMRHAVSALHGLADDAESAEQSAELRRRADELHAARGQVEDMVLALQAADCHCRPDCEKYAAFVCNRCESLQAAGAQA